MPDDVRGRIIASGQDSVGTADANIAMPKEVISPRVHSMPCWKG